MAKRLLESEFTLFQTSLVLFHVFQFVKYWCIFLELNSNLKERKKERKKEREKEKKKKKRFVPCSRPPQNVKLLGRGRATSAKKCAKTRDKTCSLSFRFFNLNLRSRCCRRRLCFNSRLAQNNCFFSRVVNSHSHF